MLELLVSFMFDPGNPTTPSMHASTLTMPNFSPNKQKFKKNQRLLRVAHYIIYRYFFMLELIVSVMFEYGNPPTPSMHVSSLTMPHFSQSKA